MRIWSNLKIANPNTTLPEYLNTLPEFQGRVAAFASWEVFDAILNKKRSGFTVNAGFTPIQEDGFADLNRRLENAPRPWKNEVRPDSLTLAYALEYIRRFTPRVCFISLGETDEYAHENNYPSYLDAARRFDAALQKLWAFLQDQPLYRDKSTLIVATDHGRGDTAHSWQTHRAGLKGSYDAWFAVMGPDTPATGEMEQGTFQLRQLAQTGAAFLGVRFSCEHPVANRIETVFKPGGANQEPALISAKQMVTIHENGLTPKKL